MWLIYQNFTLRNINSRWLLQANDVVTHHTSKLQRLFYLLSHSFGPWTHLEAKPFCLPPRWSINGVHRLNSKEASANIVIFAPQVLCRFFGQ